MKVKRADEEQGKDAVLAHARSLGHAASAEAGAPNEAPDYDATIDGMAYALEVTTVMDSLAIDGGTEVPRATVNAGLDAVAAEIEARARAEGILNGHVWMTKPGCVIDDFQRRRSEIVAAVLAFLRACEGVTDSHRTRMVIDGYGDEWITVGYFPNLSPGVVFSGGEAEYLGVVRATLRRLMSACIAEKTHVLRSESRPKMLALLAGYPHATRQLYREAFTGIEVDDFAAVVVVCGRDSVIPLVWRVPPPCTRATGS